MNLSYRFGFMCYHDDDAPAPARQWAGIRREWPTHSVEDFTFRLHPEARIEIHRRPEGAIAVVGDAYVQDGRSVAELAAALNWDDPWPALDALCGRYAILLLSGSQIRAASDAFGSRTLFYKTGQRAIASHAALLARVYGLGPDTEVADFMARPEYIARKVSYLPGDLSTQAGIFALVPNNHWDGATTRRHWPRSPLPATTPEDFYAEADRYFAAFVPFVRSRYTPVFGVTGGIDSRAAFAAFGGDFRGASWTNHLPVIERPIIEKIVAHLNVEHKYLRPKAFPRGALARAGGIATGGLRPGHLISEAMGATYGPGHAFIRGYGGEILRGFGAYDKRLKKLDAHTMSRAYSSSMRSCVKTPSYYAFCDRAFEGFRQRANYADVEEFGFKPMDLFYWEHRMGMWGANMLNEMDPGCYALVAFNSRPLYAIAFGLPDEARMTKQLLADYARRHDAKLAEIEYI